MKKVFKILGWIVLSVLLIIGAIALFIHFSGIPSYETEVVDIQVESSPEKLERGKKLSQMLCAGCHLDHKTKKLSGKKMSDVPELFGEIYSANITQDKTHGIGNYTDGELVYLLRTGIKRDGQYAPPYMAKLPHMADEDIEAIIAFLRSDDPMVQAAPVADQPCKPSFFTKMLCRMAFKPFPMPDHSIEMPDTNNLIELGEYYAHNLDCFSCHSADFATNDYLNPPNSPGYFAGGNKPLDLEGRVMLTSNLTPDKETGIGTWSKEKFVRAVKHGLVEGEHALQYPMFPYTQLTDKEAGAIYEYLRTIPAIKNDVPRSDYD